VLDCNRHLREWRLPEMVSYRALCREIAGMSFGELDMVAARSVIRRYSTEWFEAAKRRRAGMVAGFPRRKKALLSVRWYHGTFRIDGDRLRVPVPGPEVVSVKKGARWSLVHKFPRKLRRTQRRQEARHRRRIRQAHHEAAKAVVTWAVDHRVGTLRVGDPEGICKRDMGRRQDLRPRN
jgi:transposase